VELVLMFFIVLKSILKPILKPILKIILYTLEGIMSVLFKKRYNYNMFVVRKLLRYFKKLRRFKFKNSKSLFIAIFIILLVCSPNFVLKLIINILFFIFGK